MLELRLGLRTKVILISSFLLILPWLGYKYVWEMEKLLRQGQEQTLIGTTRAVATALNERPKLFNRQASFLQSVEKGRDLYAYELYSPILLDGKIGEWVEYDDKMMVYGRDHVQFSRRPYTANSISFKHMVGHYQGYLYAVFAVKDQQPVMRRTDTMQVDRNDHLVIAMTSSDGDFQRYVISPYQDGRVNAFQISEEEPDSKQNDTQPSNTDPTRIASATVVTESNIQGFWQTTEQGYNVELRIPLALVGSKLGFAFYDVNNERDREIDTIIGTSNTSHLNRLGTVLIPSPDIDNILKGMGHTGSRIWIIDRHQRVLAQTGDIQQSNGVWSTSIKYGQETDSWWSHLEERFLHPFYYKFLISEPVDFVDSHQDTAYLKGVHISQALQGRGYSHWRLSEDSNAMILAAAYPIWLSDHVMGAVVAEESTNGIQTLRNRALEKLFNVILAIIAIGTITLFLFASNISSRIRLLRDEAEQAIDSQGRITKTISPTSGTDEIGDLSRSLAAMVSRLSQYNHYLESLSSRLSHELRTPVAVVRSSIENLSMQNQDEDSQRYIARAHDGIHRLSTILSNMTEATRIEQSLQGAEKESFPLNELISGCMQGYQMAYPEQTFNVKLPDSAIIINGAPDYLAQLLDKLIANAEDFSRNQDPIEVSLERHNNEARLVVSNQGPPLPENMSDQLLNSMVSVRTQDKQTKPHLGLGLFIARLISEYHQGSIRLRNRADNKGVEAILLLPLS
ncbi:proteobacterial dedicated sortase system histidine kinase [Photobacterium sp.]|uniref:proteobacterial dedicated sortase system histidine kinase n=1 Tax=Photobacterium sp. TaxID=660 RepID=UPI00299E935E|nr:proteobacterial dedicated sortase system histidine kinase [Photobacterium sp.]MDX1302087.1 proteobacterial dedicated sortase system histidine kinase [Photobacterium sp.]